MTASDFLDCVCPLATHFRGSTAAQGPPLGDPGAIYPRPGFHAMSKGSQRSADLGFPGQVALVGLGFAVEVFEEVGVDLLQIHQTRAMLRFGLRGTGTRDRYGRCTGRRAGGGVEPLIAKIKNDSLCLGETFLDRPVPPPPECAPQASYAILWHSGRCCRVDLEVIQGHRPCRLEHIPAEAAIPGRQTHLPAPALPPIIKVLGRSHLTGQTPARQGIMHD